MGYKDRVHAGRVLAESLQGKIYSNALVLAIPRGGAVVGAEIAAVYHLPMDLVIPRKIGVPQNPEVALGAVAQDGTLVLDKKLLALTGLTEEELKSLVQKEVAEIKRRMSLYRGHFTYPDYQGRQIILVDDGIATGYTVLAALRFVKYSLQPEKMVLAVPVAPQDILEKLKPEVQELVCPLPAEDFQAVGQYYLDFAQTKDQEVIDKLNTYAVKERPQA